MAGFNYSTVDGNLTLNGIPMKTRAWTCPDLTPLWLPATLRGQDRLLPFVDGVVPYRRRRTVTEYALDFRVSGISDAAGNPPSGGLGNGIEEFEQLEFNLDYLRQNVLDPEASSNPDGTIPGVLTMPSGEVRTANVHVLGFSVTARVAHVLQGVLDISVPSGGFA
jgi:hypothetical protein